MPLDLSKAQVDLENVDYDDVLHLYRGWRRAEIALKEKIKECDELKDTAAKFDGNHAKFKHQIRALESVKDLTINLQSQLNMMKSENIFLTDELKRLTEAQQKMKDSFSTKKNHAVVSPGSNIGTPNAGGIVDVRQDGSADADARVAAQDMQTEFDLFRQKYQDMEKKFKAMEAAMANEKGARAAVETRCTSLDEVVETLRAENGSLRLRMNATVQRADQCDLELAASAEAQAKLAKELSGMHHVRDLLLTAEAQVGVLKGDIARLLRLMEHYPAAEDFLDRWHASEGMAFMGMPTKSRSQVTNVPATSTAPREVYSNMGNIDDDRDFDDYDDDDHGRRYDLSKLIETYRYFPHPPHPTTACLGIL